MHWGESNYNALNISNLCVATEVLESEQILNSLCLSKFVVMARIQTAEITFENVAICCSSKRASLE